jgi:hypothetical protein
MMLSADPLPLPETVAHDAGAVVTLMKARITIQGKPTHVSLDSVSSSHRRPARGAGKRTMA